MSLADEDTELRDLLVQTLDKNGVLGKIKAELRASIFLALESHDQNKNPKSLSNPKLQKFLTEKNGQICVDLIREFLTYFNLDYSAAVFDPEVSKQGPSIRNRDLLGEKLNVKVDENKPLLSSLLSQNRTNELLPSSEQLEKVEEIFSIHENNGSIVSSSANQILQSLCPRFPDFMLQRFLEEELQNYPENLSLHDMVRLYRSLHSVCSSVSHQTSADNSININDFTSVRVKNSKNERNVSPLSKSLSEPKVSESQGLAEDYLRPTEMEDMESSDHFFDDDVYPPNKPTSKLPPLSPSKSISNPTMSSWQVGRKPPDYEDDFNSASHQTASISEDIQAGDSIMSSTQSSMVDLTEDHSVGEKGPRNMDYIEDIK